MRMQGSEIYAFLSAVRRPSAKAITYATMQLVGRTPALNRLSCRPRLPPLKRMHTQAVRLPSKRRTHEVVFTLLAGVRQQRAGRLHAVNGWLGRERPYPLQVG